MDEPAEAVPRALQALDPFLERKLVDLLKALPDVQAADPFRQRPPENGVVDVQNLVSVEKRQLVLDTHAESIAERSFKPWHLVIRIAAPSLQEGVHHHGRGLTR